jgi:DNA-binding NarL/FixJ family response regulator
MSLRLVLADDQELIRTGFRMILESAGMEVVGEAADGKEAIERVQSLKPDVVLMDVRMPHMDGVEATRAIASAPEDDRARVLILTTFDLDEYVYAALRAGASGFLLKDAPKDELLRAIHAVAAGDALIAPSITRRLIDEFARRPDVAAADPASVQMLTPREIDVLKLVAGGLSNSEIAAQLVVGEATIKTHVGHVLMKLGVRDRVQAVVFAYENGLVKPGAL